MNFTQEALALEKRFIKSLTVHDLEKLAAAIQSAYERGEQSGPAPQPRVKPLVWEVRHPNDLYIARSIFGKFGVWDGHFRAPWHIAGVAAANPKAAAQADYETRILSTLESAPAIPAGWKLVPVEPTQNMISAGISQRHDEPAPKTWELATENIYRAMLEAAPEAR